MERIISLLLIIITLVLILCSCGEQNVTPTRTTQNTPSTEPTTATTISTTSTEKESKPLTPIYTQGLKLTPSSDGSSYSVSVGEDVTVTSIIIPSFYDGRPITSIDKGGFRDCATFYFCSSIKSIVIPDSVKEIEISAFQYCTGLVSITISKNVTFIGRSAFEDCRSLTSITYKGTKSEWDAIEKDRDWNLNTGNYTIHCTDGDIKK